MEASSVELASLEGPVDDVEAYTSEIYDSGCLATLTTLSGLGSRHGLR